MKTRNKLITASILLIACSSSFASIWGDLDDIGKIVPGVIEMAGSFPTIVNGVTTTVNNIATNPKNVNGGTVSANSQSIPGYQGSGRNQANKQSTALNTMYNGGNDSFSNMLKKYKSGGATCNSDGSSCISNTNAAALLGDESILTQTQADAANQYLANVSGGGTPLPSSKNLKPSLQAVEYANYAQTTASLQSTNNFSFAKAKGERTLMKSSDTPYTLGSVAPPTHGKGAVYSSNSFQNFANTGYYHSKEYHDPFASLPIIGTFIIAAQSVSTISSQVGRLSDKTSSMASSVSAIGTNANAASYKAYGNQYYNDAVASGSSHYAANKKQPHQ